MLHERCRYRRQDPEDLLIFLYSLLGHLCGAVGATLARQLHIQVSDFNQGASLFFLRAVVTYLCSLPSVDFDECCCCCFGCRPFYVLVLSGAPVLELKDRCVYKKNLLFADKTFECGETFLDVPIRGLTLGKTAAVRDITKQMRRSPLLQKSSLAWVCSSSERRMRTIRRRRRQHLLAAYVLLVVTGSVLQSRVTHPQSDRPLRGRRLMHITIRVSTHHNCDQVHTNESDLRTLCSSIWFIENKCFEFVCSFNRTTLKSWVTHLACCHLSSPVPPGSQDS